ncbi:hypothetical protein [Paraburkholderia sp. D1E]|uniref:hypothetical protein n=1 Tax=Paraburkholderia sp. D1E TaxID=3461398 RepID=UPI0040463961
MPARILLAAAAGLYVSGANALAGAIAALSAAAMADLLLGLPRSIGAGLPVATLRERIQVARQPVIPMTLPVTTR